MSRQKLIKQLKERNPKLNQLELEYVVDILTDNISEILKKNSSLEIRGFGRWYCKKIKENFNMRNPATRELIYKPERIKVRFKPSKELNQKINE